MTLSKTQFGNTGRRNLLINGEYQIFQRATSATNPSGGYDTADRWRSSQSSSGWGNYNAEQSTDTPDGFGFSYKLTNTSATTQSSGVRAWFEQYIEGQNLQHLNYGSSSAKKLTLSFHVKSSIAGTYGVFIGDGEFGKHNVQTYTISSANTWEKKVLTYNGDTSAAIANDNSKEFNVGFVVGCGTDFHTSSTNTWTSGDKITTSSQTQWKQTDGATFFITGVQLEVGDTATEFEHHSAAEELVLCQRYYWRFGTGDPNYTPIGTGVAEGTFSNVAMFYPTKMRAAPSIVFDGIQVFDGSTLTGVSSARGSYIGTRSVNQQFNHGSLTTGRGIYASLTGTSSYLSFDSELS